MNPSTVASLAKRGYLSLQGDTVESSFFELSPKGEALALRLIERAEGRAPTQREKYEQKAKANNEKSRQGLKRFIGGGPFPFAMKEGESVLEYAKRLFARGAAEGGSGRLYEYREALIKGPLTPEEKTAVHAALVAALPLPPRPKEETPRKASPSPKKPPKEKKTKPAPLYQHGGPREGAGRPRGSKSAKPSILVHVRIAQWAAEALIKRAQASSLSQSDILRFYLEAAARAVGGEPPPSRVRRILDSPSTEIQISPPKKASKGRILEGTPASAPAPAAQPPKRRRRLMGKEKHAPCDGPACGYQLEGGKCTIEAPLIVAAGGGGGGIERLPARYCLTEVEELSTSHNPLTGYGPTPGYPEGAQERDYRLPAEQRKVEQIAQAFEPSLVFSTAPGAIDGLPVVTEGHIVLGGNGRTMATRLVYAGEGGVPSDTPKNYLRKHAAAFGLQPADVDKFSRPMVVRTIKLPKGTTAAEWSRRLNTSLSQELDPTRLAVSRARYLSVHALEPLRELGDDETLAAFLSSTRSKPFVRSLQSAGIIDARSAPQLLTSEGLLSDKGKSLVDDLLLAVILPDADAITALGKGLVSTLARSAPFLLQTAPMGAYDLLPSLRAALRDKITMEAQGLSESNFLRQGGLFGVDWKTTNDPLGRVLLSVLVQLGGSPTKLLKLVKGYLREAKGPAAGQSALFATEHLSPLAALQKVAKEAGVVLPR